MFKVDTKDVRKLTDNLKRLNKNAFPKTIWYTLNRMARGTALQGKQNIAKSFTIRNKYIQGSVGFKSKKTFDINSMESDAGQFAVYKAKPTGQLEKQEFGIAVNAKGKYTFAATPSARGGSYKKAVKKSNLLNSLNVRKLNNLVANQTKDNTKQSKQAQAYAIRHNKKINVMLTNSKGHKGIYTVSKKSVSLLYDLRNRKTNIKKTEWLKPASDKVIAKADRIYVSEARKRLEKELSKGFTRS